MASSDSLQLDTKQLIVFMKAGLWYIRDIVAA